MLSAESLASPDTIVISRATQRLGQRVPSRVETIGPETPLFWSAWGRGVVGEMEKNVWRLCKVYSSMIRTRSRSRTTYATLA